MRNASRGIYTETDTLQQSTDLPDCPAISDWGTDTLDAPVAKWLDIDVAEALTWAAYGMADSVTRRMLGDGGTCVVWVRGCRAVRLDYSSSGEVVAAYSAWGHTWADDTTGRDRMHGVAYRRCTRCGSVQQY